MRDRLSAPAKRIGYSNVVPISGIGLKNASPQSVETRAISRKFGHKGAVANLECQLEAHPDFGVGRICYIDSLPGQVDRRRQRVNLRLVIMNIYLGGSSDLNFVTDDLSAK